MTGSSVERAANFATGIPIAAYATTEAAIKTNAIPALELVIGHITINGQLGAITLQTAVVLSSTATGLILLFIAILRFLLKR